MRQRVQPRNKNWKKRTVTTKDTVEYKHEKAKQRISSYKPRKDEDKEMEKMRQQKVRK